MILQKHVSIVRWVGPHWVHWVVLFAPSAALENLELKMIFVRCAKKERTVKVGTMNSLTQQYVNSALLGTIKMHLGKHRVYHAALEVRS
jgi:hypothetical protein